MTVRLHALYISSFASTSTSFASSTYTCSLGHYPGGYWLYLSALLCLICGKQLAKHVLECICNSLHYHVQLCTSLPPHPSIFQLDNVDSASLLLFCLHIRHSTLSFQPHPFFYSLCFMLNSGSTFFFPTAPFFFLLYILPRQS